MIRFSILRRVILIIAASIFLLNQQGNVYNIQPVRAGAVDTVCRFGITSALESDGYDIASLGVGSYLDWGSVTNPELPAGMEYIHVLLLHDDIYPYTLANLPAWVQSNPGGVWIVGNEPDTTYEGQDGLLPEVYADRYYEIATIIRELDPSAKIAFGTVVQPTPIRMRYLDRAWAQLTANAGSPIQASRLVDIWSIHAFILNEQPYEWGTGIPPGFDFDHGDAVDLDPEDTYSIAIFQSRIIAFRHWLADKGERNKPLWITEYGSLMPPIDPPGGPDYYNVSDEVTTGFMLGTFDFLMGASNSQTCLPGDFNQLAQRWYWYSLNDYRYHFGGTLFDPDNGKLPTLVGQNFINYQSNNLALPDLYPASLSVAPVSYNPDRTLVNYRLDITLGNTLFPDATCAQVWIYDGDPGTDGELIVGPISASAIQSDNGTGKVSFWWGGIQPLVQHDLYVLVDSIGIIDSVPGNNLAAFSVYLDLPDSDFLPLVLR